MKGMLEWVLPAKMGCSRSIYSSHNEKRCKTRDGNFVNFSSVAPVGSSAGYCVGVGSAPDGAPDMH